MEGILKGVTGLVSLAVPRRVLTYQRFQTR
jgi:hypothetical protein